MPEDKPTKELSNMLCEFAKYIYKNTLQMLVHSIKT